MTRLVSRSAPMGFTRMWTCPSFPSAAGRVADHPTHGIPCRHGDELPARLQGDVGDLVDSGVELIESSLGVGIDLDGVDVAVLDRLDAGRAVGTHYPLLWRALVLLILCRLPDRLELPGQRQGLRHFHVFNSLL